MTSVLLRLALIAAATAVAIWGFIMVPEVADQPSLPGLEPDPYVVCPVAQAGGGFSSRVGVSSHQDGQIRVIGATGGPVIVAADGESFFTEVGELAELGTTPLLVETSGAAATYTRAGTVAAMSGCNPASEGPLAVMGMSTAKGDRSTMVLVNPFASEALVRLVGASEFGVDTPTDLEEMTVPPAATVEVVLDQALAGRQSLSFAVVADSGLVTAGMNRTGPGDVASLEAVAGGTEWFFPLPDFGFDGEIHLRSLGDVDAPFRVDRIQPDGVVEGVMEGVLLAQSLAVIPVEEVAGPGSGVVISAAEPVAAAVVYAIDDARAVAPGLLRESTRWSSPVSGVLDEGQAAVWILNTSGQSLTGRIERLGISSGPGQSVDLPAGMTTGAFVTGATGGALEISADGPIVVFYGVLSGNSIGLGAAVPTE